MGDVVSCASCGAKVRIPTSAHGIPRCPRCHVATAWLVAASDADFPEVVRTQVPVLLDLWAPWCGPCRVVAPAVEQIARDMAGDLKVVKVNVDEAPHTAARYDARSIPTLVVLKDGNPIARQVGALPQAALSAWVRNVIEGVRT